MWAARALNSTFPLTLEWNAIWRAKEMRPANASRSLSLGGHVFTRHFIHELGLGWSTQGTIQECLPGFVFHSAVATCCLNVLFVSRTVWLGKTNYRSQNIGRSLWWFPVQERYLAGSDVRSSYLADGQRWKSANLTGKEENTAPDICKSARFARSSFMAGGPCTNDVIFILGFLTPPPPLFLISSSIDPFYFVLPPTNDVICTWPPDQFEKSSRGAW